MAVKRTISKSSVSAPVSTTPVRNTAIPRVESRAKSAAKTINQDMIAQRAYEIWQSGKGGTEFQNWVQAERELKGL